ncbi:hypothetical protein C8Q74DRAFT_1218124 [Fomes fomentarius]|nr:hypothetical protein C8Q74DRAFT_1218124 [Fomes fomentarius]
MVPSVIPSLLLLAATFSSQVAAHPHETHDHTHAVRANLPGTWYHSEAHPVHALFKRNRDPLAKRGDDGIQYAAVGTPEWSAGFPTGKMDPNGAGLPKAWVDALNAAVKAGKIPDLPTSTSDGGNPVYPQGFDPLGPTVCSATYKCRNKEDLWDAPDGVFASSFDDGPLPEGIPLYNFLKEHNSITTHFMIGVNILYNSDAFKAAYEDLQSDIAVHTWTHPYMTTMNNLQVVGELGWTMEIIHNSTGGRIPKYWRPPMGDSDERVRAIAKEVFGLTTVIWNQDTEDWSVGSPGGSTVDQVNADLHKWITGPKSPGLVILEHELNNITVGAFINAYPLIAQNGWKFESLARLANADVYQNAVDNTGDVIAATVGVGGATEPSASVSSSGSGTGTAKPTSTGGSGGQQNNSNGTSTTSASPTGAAENGGAGSRSTRPMSFLALVAAAVALA